ncbi:MAG: gamma-butyrobetaine hydroxylase-like domain-containing protein, partial [Myxococcota bacterium]|nr:gamma-butyrobetaine hydroxylase-like domain-containing protein [Myxococcota bacterium]
MTTTATYSSSVGPRLGRDGFIRYGRDALGLHPAWLRDNCPCPQCRHPQTEERILFTASVPVDICPRSVEVSAEGDLHVVWEDPGGPHVSRYPATWLREHANPTAPSGLCPPGVRLWRSESLNLQRFDWARVMTEDTEVLRWCRVMRADGVAMIENTPAEHGEVERV